jgi:hypothetical protein
MFERVLYDVLTDSLRRLVDRPQILDVFLAGLPLQDDAEREGVREIVLEFARGERPVMHGYARDDTAFPVWSIVLANESESLRALGDETDDDDSDGRPIRASVWDSTFQVLVYAQHPDVTLWLYQLLRATLISRRVELVQRSGALNVSTLSGAELSPDRIWLPSFLFVRAATLTVQGVVEGLFNLEANTDQPSTARRIVGVHVDDARAEPDGLRHLVRAYGGEQE